MGTKAVTKLTLFAEMDALKTAALDELCALVQKPYTAALNIAKRIEKSFHRDFKAVAAAKRRFASRLAKNEIPPGSTFAQYWSENYGGKLPGRLEQGAHVFNCLVLMLVDGKPLVCEEFIDAAKNAWIEAASVVLKAAQKEFGDDWKTSQDVLDLIHALSVPGDAGKKIKEIRDRQRARAGEKSEDDELTPLTTSRSVEFLKSEIAKVSDMAENDVRELYMLTLSLSAAWSKSGVDNKTQAKWTAEFDEDAPAHMEIKTSETEAEEAPAETAPEALAA